MKNIKVFDSEISHPYIDVVKKSFENCLEYKSQLPSFILELEGMSGKKYRHFINNVIGSISDARYLEIGSWKGSTLCSAIFNNDVVAYAIDDWSTDGGPKTEFNRNIENCIEKSDNDLEINVHFEENDYSKVDYSEIGKYNVFFYDGAHEEEHQYQGIVLASQSLDDVFVLIVDDWNWADPKNGTNKAITDLNLEILYSVEIDSTEDYNSGAVFQNSDWHNGYFISVVKKTKTNNTKNKKQKS